MLCPNCSETIKDTAKWCGHCGHKIEEPALQKPKPEPVPDPIPEAPARKVAISSQKPVKKKKRPAQPAKAKSVPTKEKPAKPEEKRKPPLWAWIVGLIILGAVVAFGLTKIPQQIAVAKACSAPVFTKTYKPLSITYGYWGFLNDFERENLDSVSCQFMIEGDAYPISDDVNLVSTADVPCAKISPGSFCDENECIWLTYTTKIVNGFPPGRYTVDIVCSARDSIRDGLRDDYGMLVTYGPGNILEYDFILIVE